MKETKETTQKMRINDFLFWTVAVQNDKMLSSDKDGLVLKHPNQWLINYQTFQTLNQQPSTFLLPIEI